MIPRRFQQLRTIIALTSIVLNSIILLSIYPYYKSPKWVAIADYELILVICLMLFGFLVFSLFCQYQKKFSDTLTSSNPLLPRGLSLISLCAFIVIMLMGSLCLKKEWLFYQKKQAVLNAPPHLLNLLNPHFIVGFPISDELITLVKKQTIGGIYLTQQVQSFSKQQLQLSISKIKQSYKNPALPFWIASDQEGGIVSRLTPPLANTPNLGSLIDENTDQFDTHSIQAYAAQKSIQLKELGVNINLAPVVDLKTQTKVIEDKHSLISQRAISYNPLTVNQTALLYCQTLLLHGVIPTLKHFPGLGSVTVDTHHRLAKLNTPIDILASKDWVPFFNIAATSPAMIMVGHVALTQIDPHFPASYSSKVIQQHIRSKLPNTVLITDDMNMDPVFFGSEGIGNATVKALQSGMDLILISYDARQYYLSMHSALIALENGEITIEQLQRSQKRLKNLASHLHTIPP